MGLSLTVDHSETLKGLFIEATSVAICNQLGSPRFPQGHLAAIQQSRHAPEVDTLLGRYEIPPDEREAWGVVVHGIAGATPPGITIHAPEAPFGRALALAGVSSGDVAELVGGAGPSLAAAVSRACCRLQAARAARGLRVAGRLRPLPSQSRPPGPALPRGEGGQASRHRQRR